MMTPKISLVAFLDRPAATIFVAIPNERNRYLRTDKSVSVVRCPQCQSIPGEPCKYGAGDSTKYVGSTHYLRRQLGLRIFGHGYKANDVAPPEMIDDVEFSS